VSPNAHLARLDVGPGRGGRFLAALLRKAARKSPTAHPPLHRKARNRLPLQPAHLPLRPHPHLSPMPPAADPLTLTSIPHASHTRPLGDFGWDRSAFGRQRVLFGSYSARFGTRRRPTRRKCAPNGTQ